MSDHIGVGITAMGLYLPSEIRTNDYWSADVVKTWLGRMDNIIPRSIQAVDEVTEGVNLVMKTLDKLRSDPFQGSKERRVISRDELGSDMAAQAARQAIEASGLGADKIDLLLSHAMLPDYICVNQASIIHEKLGLRPDAVSFTVDSVCSSFLPQFQVARGMIASGQAKNALLTQASNCTPIMPEDQPLSAWFGDAASAFIVGPVDKDLGLKSIAFRTDGTFHKGFVASVPNKRWYDEGRLIAGSADKNAARKMQLICADAAREVIDDAFAQAGVTAKDVNFFACHQPAFWFPDVCQEFCGLQNAKTINTFAFTGNLSNVNVPIQLVTAQKEGMLKKGDLVAMFTMSAGMMVTAAVMRWAI